MMAVAISENYYSGFRESDESSYKNLSYRVNIIFLTTPLNRMNGDIVRKHNKSFWVIRCILDKIQFKTVCVSRPKQAYLEK